MTIFTIIAPSRSRPGIPSRNASSGIVSSLRPGAVTSPVVSAREAVAQAVEQLAEVEQRLDLGAVEGQDVHVRSVRTIWAVRANGSATTRPSDSESAARSSPSARAEQDVALQRVGGVERGEAVELATVVAVGAADEEGGHGRDGTGAIATEKDAIRADSDAARHDLLRGARAAPSALFRGGRRGAQLLPRGRSVAHGRVAAQRGDPPARERAGRRAVHAHDAARRADRGGPAAARRRRVRAGRGRRGVRGRDPRRGAACSARCGSGTTPAARYEIRPALLARLREQHPGHRGRRLGGDDGQPVPRAAQPAARRRDRLLRRARCPGSCGGRSCTSRCTC